MRRERKKDRRTKEERKKGRRRDKKDCGAWVVSWALSWPSFSTVLFHLDLSCGLSVVDFVVERGMPHMAQSGTGPLKPCTVHARRRRRRAKKRRRKDNGRSARTGLSSFDSFHFTLYIHVHLVQRPRHDASCFESTLSAWLGCWTCPVSCRLACLFLVVSYDVIMKVGKLEGRESYTVVRLDGLGSRLARRSLCAFFYFALLHFCLASTVFFCHNSECDE